MIPESKKPAVQLALQSAFGADKIENIRQLTAGLSSALVFRIVVLGKPYLLRIITRTDPMADPTNHYATMRMGAQAGLAPYVWYTSIEDRISITDFAEPKPLPVDHARKTLPGMIRHLHALTPFPHPGNYLDTMDGIVRKFQTSNILPENKTVHIFEQYERIKTVYPRDAKDLVLCHNDLKADNILFDGTQIWIVDWEAAFLNDRYVDLAVVANFVIKHESEESDYLKSYFGTEVDGYTHARFFLMRQLMHLFYTAFLFVIENKETPVDLDQSLPDFNTFHDLLWQGKLNVGDGTIKHQYALVHLEQLRQNLAQSRFEESLKTVGLLNEKSLS